MDVVPINFDVVLRTIGQMGRYQKFMVAFLIIPACFMNSFLAFAPIFFYHEAKSKCLPNEEQNVLYAANGSSYNIQYGECNYSIYQNVSLINGSMIMERIAGTNYGQCDNWTYYDQIMQTNAVNKWNLVCNDHFYISLLIGLGNGIGVIGCAILGWAQDRFGRKATLYVTISIYIIGCLPSAFVDSFTAFVLLRGFASLSAITGWNLAYLYALEYVGPSKRTLTSSLFCFVYAIGTITVGGLAYAFNDLQSFILITSVPFLILFIFYPIVMESPRWLISQGRLEDAKWVVKRMIRWDGVKAADKDLDRLLGVKVRIVEELRKDEFVPKKNFELFKLFKSKTLRWIIGVITYAWIANAITYYAIAYNVENIGGYFFTTYIIQAAVELPAVLLNLLLLNRFGRIWPLVFAMLACGSCALLTALTGYIPEGVVVALAISAKFGICMSYAIIYQLATELYPTEYRGFCLGFSSIMADIGNIAMPYIVELAGVYRSLPMIVLGVLCITGGMVVLLLPETKNKHMPETVEQVERFVPIGVVSFRENIDRLFKRKKCVNRSANNIVLSG